MGYMGTLLIPKAIFYLLKEDYRASPKMISLLGLPECAKIPCLRFRAGKLSKKESAMPSRLGEERGQHRCLPLGGPPTL